MPLLAGIDLRSPGELEKIDQKVENNVRGIIEQLKKSHNKFEDTDFGPTLTDEYGALSFYGNAKPDPAGSKYPAPETLRWERPQYADQIFSNKKGSADHESVQQDDDDDVTMDEDDVTVEFDEEEDDDEFGFRTREEDSKVVCRSILNQLC